MVFQSPGLEFSKLLQELTLSTSGGAVSSAHGEQPEGPFVFKKIFLLGQRQEVRTFTAPQFQADVQVRATPTWKQESGHLRSCPTVLSCVAASWLT